LAPATYFGIVGGSSSNVSRYSLAMYLPRDERRAGVGQCTKNQFSQSVFDIDLFL